MLTKDAQDYLVAYVTGQLDDDGLRWLLREAHENEELLFILAGLAPVRVALADPQMRAEIKLSAATSPSLLASPVDRNVGLARVSNDDGDDLMPGQRPGHVTDTLSGGQRGEVAPMARRTGVMPRSPAAWSVMGLIAASLLVSVVLWRQTSQTVLADGPSTLVIDRSGRVTGLQGLQGDERSAVEAAIRTGQVEAPPGIVGRGVLLGITPSDADILLRPIGAALETQPVFEWKDVVGATDYSVQLVNASGRLVADSGWLKVNRWIPLLALTRSETYRWQLVARVDGREQVYPPPPAREARFRVLDEPLATRIDDARRRLGSSHLAMAVLYARNGLMYEARTELNALQSANPQAELPKALIQSLSEPR